MGTKLNLTVTDTATGETREGAVLPVTDELLDILDRVAEKPAENVQEARDLSWAECAPPANPFVSIASVEPKHAVALAEVFTMPHHTCEELLTSIRRVDPMIASYIGARHFEGWRAKWYHREIPAERLPELRTMALAYLEANR